MNKTKCIAYQEMPTELNNVKDSCYSKYCTHRYKSLGIEKKKKKWCRGLKRGYNLSSNIYCINNDWLLDDRAHCLHI